MECGQPHGNLFDEDHEGLFVQNPPFPEGDGLFNQNSPFDEGEGLNYPFTSFPRVDNEAGIDLGRFSFRFFPWWLLNNRACCPREQRGV